MPRGSAFYCGPLVAALPGFNYILQIISIQRSVGDYLSTIVTSRRQILSLTATDVVR